MTATSPGPILEARIHRALEYIERCGGIDGAHHKQWVLDQVVRALTGCPMVLKTKAAPDGRSYTYTIQGESDEYKRWVATHCAGEDGPETYEWDIGIPP